MVTLTFQDKKTLIEMLSKHYTIEESAFIKAIAQNEEEEVELTLKAFSLKAKSKVAVQQVIEEHDIVNIDNIPDATVKIGHLGVSKLCLIKAVKETTHIGLEIAKSKIDQIVGFGSNGQFMFVPFKVGSTSSCLFTKEQWLTISNYTNSAYGKDSLNWKYV